MELHITVEPEYRLECYRNVVDKLNSLESRHYISRVMIIPNKESDLDVYDDILVKCNVIVMGGSSRRYGTNELFDAIQESHGKVTMGRPLYSKEFETADIDSIYEKADKLLYGIINPDTLTKLDRRRISVLLNYGRRALLNEYAKPNGYIQKNG